MLMVARCVITQTRNYPNAHNKYNEKKILLYVHNEITYEKEKTEIACNKMSDRSQMQMSTY